MEDKKLNNIYFFIPFYPQITTGVNKYHSIVFNSLKRINQDVKVFGSDSNMVKIENSKILKIIYGIKYSLKLPGKSIIVLTNTSFLHFLIPVLMLNIFKRHKYFMVIHHLLRDQESKKFVKLFESIFIKLIKNKITVSKSTNDRLKFYKYIKKDIPILPPGLEFLPDIKYLRKRISGVVKLLFVGNIEKRKSLHTLINALKLLMTTEFELTIIGRISEQQYYESILTEIDRNHFKGKTIFKENISPEELRRIYINSDILIFPSEWEGYGMVITEAMSSGLPVIASRIPTSEELIFDKFNGLLFDVNNEKCLSDSILRLIFDKELYTLISKNSIEKSLTLKNWEKTSIDFLNYLDIFK